MDEPGVIFLKERTTSCRQNSFNENFPKPSSGKSVRSKVSTGGESVESQSQKVWNPEAEVCLKTYYVCSLFVSTLVLFTMIVSFVSSGWETVFYQETTLLTLAQQSETFQVRKKDSVCDVSRKVTSFYS